MPEPVPVRQAVRSLTHKGFSPDERDHHRYTYRDDQGRKTGQYIYFSRGGAASREVGPALLKRMARELHLATIAEVVDLLDCTMTEAEFVRKTRE